MKNFLAFWENEYTGPPFFEAFFKYKEYQNNIKGKIKILM
jgi:hypothetical protein